MGAGGCGPGALCRDLGSLVGRCLLDRSEDLDRPNQGLHSGGRGTKGKPIPGF